MKQSGKSVSRIVWRLRETRYPQDQYGHFLQYGSRYYVGAPPPELSESVISAPIATSSRTRIARKPSTTRSTRAPSAGPSSRTAVQPRSASRARALDPPSSPFEDPRAPTFDTTCAALDCSKQLTPGVRSQLCEDCRSMVSRVLSRKRHREPSRERGRSPGPALFGYVDIVVPLRDPSEAPPAKRLRSRSVSVPRASKQRRNVTPAPKRRRSAPSAPASPSGSGVIPGTPPETVVEASESAPAVELEQPPAANGTTASGSGEEKDRVMWRGKRFDFDGTSWKERNGTRPSSPPAAEAKSQRTPSPLDVEPSTSVQVSAPPPPQLDVPPSPITMSFSETVAMAGLSNGNVASLSRTLSNGSTSATKTSPPEPSVPEKQKSPHPARSPPKFLTLADAIMQAHTPASPASSDRAGPSNPKPLTKSPSVQPEPPAEPPKSAEPVSQAASEPVRELTAEPIRELTAEPSAAPPVKSTPDPQPEQEPGSQDKAASEPPRSTTPDDDPEPPVEYARSVFMFDDIKRHVNLWRKGTANESPQDRHFHGFYRQMVDPAIVTSFPVTPETMTKIATEFSTNGKLVFK